MIIQIRKARLISLGVSFAILVTCLVVFNHHSTYGKVQNNHVSSRRTVCVDGHDHWTNDMKPTESMSAEEMYRYLHWTNSTSCKLAIDFGQRIVNDVKLGSSDGHKAVCLDNHITPDFGNCLVYSFGINNEWTFDDAMAQFGCQVYAFDPSMNVSAHNRSELIHFYDLGLDGQDRLHPTKGWQMKTASSIYKMLASQHGASTLIDVLKMDVEFSEWVAIPQMVRSGFLADKVKQLAVEIHFKADDPLDVFRHRVQILRDLEAPNQGQVGAGFVRFSSRPNPFLQSPVQVLGNKEGSVGLELAWYNPKYY